MKATREMKASSFNISPLSGRSLEARRLNQADPVQAGLPRACWSVRQPAAAFSLLEVMIAMAIFFVAVFGILALTAQNIRTARNLREIPISASTLAAELSLTNILEEGYESGDFGDLYPGATWTREIYLVGTNGLFQVDFTVQSPPGVTPAESSMSILLFRPESPSGRGVFGR